MQFSKTLKLLHGICLAETYADGHPPSSDLADYSVLDSAHYLSSYITFKAIQAAERQPALERSENFDMLSVYQAYAMLVYAYCTVPLAPENIAPDFQTAQVVVAKTLFAGIPEAELVEILENGFHKFKLIGEAETEHWSEFRENLDKVTMSFLIAATDDDSPHNKEEMLPLFGQLLSQLCEAFEQN